MLINADWASCLLSRDRHKHAWLRRNKVGRQRDELANREDPCLALLTGAQKWALRDLATAANKGLRGFLGEHGNASGRYNLCDDGLA
ncbi:hypothetical protein GGR55DRAFT_624702 [Xylaria sp. FL0064]|nr:hypothetical protein GGR55DRAFT_624702 [Xylaria sp. FL0064]